MTDEDLEAKVQADMERAKIASDLSALTSSIKQGHELRRPELDAPKKEKGLSQTKTVRASIAAIAMIVVDWLAVKDGIDMGAETRTMVYGVVASLVAVFMRSSQLKIERALPLIVAALLLGGCCGHERAFATIGTALNGKLGDRALEAIEADDELTGDRRTDERINLWLLCKVVEEAGGPPNTRKYDDDED